MCRGKFGGKTNLRSASNGAWAGGASTRAGGISAGGVSESDGGG